MNVVNDIDTSNLDKEQLVRKQLNWSFMEKALNPLNANPTKWSNTFKQFIGVCLSVFDHFVILALKGLIKSVNTHEGYDWFLTSKTILDF